MRGREPFPPTFEQVATFAARHEITPEFAKSWFDQMVSIYGWRHPKDGMRIRNWRRNLQLWWKRRDDFDPLPAQTAEASIREREEAAAAALKGLGL